MNTKFVKKIFLGLALSFVVFSFSLRMMAQAPSGEATLPMQEEVEPEEPSAPPAVAPVAPPTAKPGDAGQAKDPAAATTPVPADDDSVYLNVQDQDIKEVIKAISKFTGRNFIIDSKVSGKVTILSHSKMTKDQAYQAFLSALETAGFTTVEGPAGLLKVIPLKDAKNFPIPTHIDTTPYTDSYITRLIKLENISAGEMANAIKGLISRNGDLFAYPETNTLVITDSGTNIDRLMKIIKELDQEGPQEVVEIIPIHYASAKEIAGIVLNLFEEEKNRQTPRRGDQPEEVASVSKIIADERTNSIIVLASKRAIDKVKELINRLDARLEEGAEGKIHVHYLKYAKASDITSVLQGLSGTVVPKPAAAAGGAAPKAGESGAMVAELEDFKVAADETTNSLLITASPKTYRVLVEKVIDKLDIPRKQVYLEALIMEFILRTGKALGVKASGGAEGPLSMLGFGQTFNQLAGLIDPFSAGNSNSALINSPGLLGGILSRQTVDMRVTQSDGTIKVFSVPGYSAFITALSTIGDTHI
ncbi:MAG: secretin N-terminal domain-containing protein, partial [Deltaproteobacteria bacterium]|nr:secretin N-terminal domain-containing protein [Deltaproteobacteria bacterium]